MGMEGGEDDQKTFSTAKFRSQVEEQIGEKINVGRFKWNNWIPKKITYFAWRLLLGCIPSKGAMVHRGINIGDTTCGLCGFTFSFSPMKFTLLHVLTLVSVALVGSHAVTPETYWKSVLPNSPMPKAVKDLLYATEWNNEKVAAEKPVQGPSVGVGKGGIGMHSGNRRNPVSVGLHPGKNPFVYNYAPSNDQLKDDPNVALFFLENDLHQGTEMNLHFTKKTDHKSMFLPRKTADSIPFSSTNLSQIYHHFSIKPDSLEAEAMKQTLSDCENKGIEGEEKCCATSLESMIDFITTKLGQKVKAISTEVKGKECTTLQKYKIEFAKKLDANKAVVCHKQNFAYAVFYCHKTVGMRAYAVSMVGTDGVKVNAVAACHTDTAKWNPKHLAFRVLKVKPGSVPVCHFLPEDHVVWIPY
ncbi:hypothetical protein L1987_61258 [Smallanthus sonchifolius]|uniref:Uncharacterized protein n=1 Tax=Smallanthus sonchifolius TaxID=185202 RepID=A0ACB9DAQ0_9ASTR|nr:hypothetical protein L1987_61258 [Smallanthus sonchifolius]